ncbi:MAG: hypothetical protein R2771_12970 [Saprospiraceae bacterium]
MLFEIDSVNVSNYEGKYIANTFIEQKLYHAPNYHCNVPIVVSFYDSDNKRYDFKHKISDQFSNISDTLSFIPSFWTLNEDQYLNNSQLGVTQYYLPNKSYILTEEKTSIETNDLQSDSILLRIEHIWGAPDSIKNKPVSSDFFISDQHYWVVNGILEDNNDIKMSFPYLGFKESDIRL